MSSQYALDFLLDYCSMFKNHIESRLMELQVKQCKSVWKVIECYSTESFSSYQEIEGLSYKTQIRVHLFPDIIWRVQHRPSFRL